MSRHVDADCGPPCERRREDRRGAERIALLCGQDVMFVVNQHACTKAETTKAATNCIFGTRWSCTLLAIAGAACASAASSSPSSFPVSCVDTPHRFIQESIPHTLRRCRRNDSPAPVRVKLPSVSATPRGLRLCWARARLIKPLMLLSPPPTPSVVQPSMHLQTNTFCF